MLCRLLIAGMLLLLPQSDETSRLEQLVEGERGGRQWIDEPTAPPKSPDESRACFQLEPGCRIELFAAEPLVKDPVWIEFDHRGRMFVVEYTDYPTGPADGSEKHLSQIVVLTDRDGNGQADQRTVFAADLDFCHSLLPLFDGILACTQTEILFLKDNDGDDIADQREVWYTGFTPAHPQMQIGCPRWGFDNQIWLTYGPGKVLCKRPGFETTEPLELPRLDVRFDPFTMQIEAVAGMGQFGNTIDNDGHRFFSTNRNPIMVQMLPREVAGRNPFAPASRLHADVGPSGGDTKVFPLVKMKSNWLSHAGTHTSACGVTAYRGDLFDATFRNTVFACEPVGHLVTRSLISPAGSGLTAVKAQADADFLASSDTWFRPASLATGPDGAVYLADMYRMWVEHPKFLPEDIAKRIDWRAGEDRGRVWRIVPEELSTGSLRPFPPANTWREQVELLKDANGWRRHLGQRLLVESQRGNREVAALRQLLNDSALIPHARLHALWTLQGIGMLQHDDLQHATADSAAVVRSAAIQLSGNFSADAPALIQNLLATAADPDPAVRLQIAIAAGELPENTAGRTAALSSIAGVDGNDDWSMSALLTASRECSGAILVSLLRNPTPPHSDKLISELARVVGQRGDREEVIQVLQTSAALPTSANATRAAILTGIAQGLPRNQGSIQSKRLDALLSTPPEELTQSAPLLSAFLTDAARQITSNEISLESRLAAVRLLAIQSPGQIQEIASSVLVPGQPGAVQMAVIEALRSAPGAQTGTLLLERWALLPPQASQAALSLMLIRPETSLQILQAMKDGSVAPSAVDIDQRLRLLKHPNPDVQQLAAQVFGDVVSSNRRAVADEYQPALHAPASADRGLLVFRKTCSKCHRIRGEGHVVGPDISDTRARSRDALLYDILDPNRRLDPQFTEYIVALKDGQVLNGLLVSDTGGQITLRQAEGREQQVDRSAIEEMRSANRSLMPEGIEKDVTVEQMADLLEFLKAGQ